jgi:hypothetical protein
LVVVEGPFVALAGAGLAAHHHAHHHEHHQRAGEQDGDVADGAGRRAESDEQDRGKGNADDAVSVVKASHG